MTEAEWVASGQDPYTLANELERSEAERGAYYGLINALALNHQSTEDRRTLYHLIVGFEPWGPR